MFSIIADEVDVEGRTFRNRVEIIAPFYLCHTMRTSGTLRIRLTPDYAHIARQLITAKI